MILSVHDLHKFFFTGFTGTIKKQILDGISFSLSQWEIYAFLGPNGAGKTTTIETIMWFHLADSGQISFFWDSNLDNNIRRRIGYAADKTAYFDHLTGRENVMLIGDYAQVEKNKKESIWHKLFDQLGLCYAKDSYVQNYSQWMKQRLGLIISLINDPELIIWDEPMSWLDPLGRIVVKNLMKKLKEQGKTILFSTHILSDVEEIADKFGILHQGKMIYEQIVNEQTHHLEELFCDLISGEKSVQELSIS